MAFHKTDDGHFSAQDYPPKIRHSEIMVLFLFISMELEKVKWTL